MGLGTRCAEKGTVGGVGVTYRKVKLELRTCLLQQFDLVVEPAEVLVGVSMVLFVLERSGVLREVVWFRFFGSGCRVVRLGEDAGAQAREDGKGADRGSCRDGGACGIAEKDA